VAGKNIGIVRPIMTRKCARCGKWFAACHPKDTEVLCERCRIESEMSELPMVAESEIRSGRDLHE